MSPPISRLSPRGPSFEDGLAEFRAALEELETRLATEPRPDDELERALARRLRAALDAYDARG